MSESTAAIASNSSEDRYTEAPTSPKLSKRRVVALSDVSAHIIFDFFLITTLATVGTLSAIFFRVIEGGGQLLALSTGSVFVALIVTVSLYFRGAYPPDGNIPSLITIVAAWVDAIGVITVSILALYVIWRVPDLRRFADPISMIVFIGTGILLALGRNPLWARLRPHLAPVLTKGGVVVIGAGNNLAAFIEGLLQQFRTIEVVSVLCDPRNCVEEVTALVRDGVAQTVFVILPDEELDPFRLLLEKLKDLSASIRVVPPMPHGMRNGCPLSLQSGFPVWHISDPPLRRASSVIKRIEDLVLSSIMVLAAAPIMLIAAAAIKLDSCGPVLFRQPRHGLNGRIIEVLKFRTMFSEAEDKLACRQTARGDARITRVGKVLRRHSLDELPQLFNVLTGTMSLVGPRPHALATSVGDSTLETALEGYLARHRVKPGITGWAQVNGFRGPLMSVGEATQRLTHDLYYIENWSVFFDLKILFRTIGLIFHDDEAF